MWGSCARKATHCEHFWHVIHIVPPRRTRTRRRHRRTPPRTTTYPQHDHQEGGMNGTERYLTVGEAAAFLNTSERFVRRLISERRVTFHYVGRHVRFAVSDLEA